MQALGLVEDCLLVDAADDRGDALANPVGQATLAFPETIDACMGAALLGNSRQLQGRGTGNDVPGVSVSHI